MYKYKMRNTQLLLKMMKLLDCNFAKYNSFTLKREKDTHI